MMGLGFKHASRELLSPRNLHKLKRSDEDLNDLIVFGAILAFGFGAFAWILIEDPPKIMFFYYDHRDEFMSFFYSVLIPFLLFLLLTWILDIASFWPRLGIFMIGTLVGLFFGVFAFLGADFLAKKVASLFVAAYSLSVAGLALFQAARIGNLKNPEP